MAKRKVKESRKSSPKVIFIEGRAVTKNIKAEIRRALIESLADVPMKRTPKEKTTKKLRKFQKELEEARKRLAKRRRKYANQSRVLVKPAGKPSIPVEKIRDAVRKCG